MRNKRIKRMIKYLQFIFIICFFGCMDDARQTNEFLTPDEENRILWFFPETIDLHLGNPATRVTYDDEGTSGVKQYWESDDEFLLYNTYGDTVSYKVSSINSSDQSMATFKLVNDEPLSHNLRTTDI